MSTDQFTQFMAAQSAINLTMTAGLSRIEQSQKDMSIRLFGGDGQPGLLTNCKECKSGLDARLGALEGARISTRAWVAGALAVFTLEGSALGLYFSKVAGHLSDLQHVLKH
jgi:hypothetical protein